VLLNPTLGATDDTVQPLLRPFPLERIKVSCCLFITTFAVHLFVLRRSTGIRGVPLILLYDSRVEQGRGPSCTADTVPVGVKVEI